MLLEGILSAKKISGAISKVQTKNNCLYLYRFTLNSLPGAVTTPSLLIPLQNIAYVEIKDSPNQYETMSQFIVSFIFQNDMKKYVEFPYRYCDRQSKETYDWKLETETMIQIILTGVEGVNASKLST
jgi:hypothetical protein